MSESPFLIGIVLGTTHSAVLYDVLQDGGEIAAGDRLAERKLSRGRIKFARENLEQRGQCQAVFAEKGDLVALVHREVHIFKQGPAVN